MRGRPTIPWSWYSDPAILELEMRRVFGRDWQYVGHLGELQGPGSYFASQTGPTPIVVTLDTDEVLRGFVNVCRHRGAIVATDARKRGTLQCPYHAWTYNLDGQLRAAPRANDDPGFDASCHGLRAVSVGTWGPFIFANPDRSSQPLEEALADLPDIVSQHGFDIGAVTFNRRVNYRINANWKIAVENYLECYHCPVNHPGLVEVIDERRLVLEADGLRTSQFAPIHAHALDGSAPIDALGEIGEGQNHLWFPNLKFNVLPGHPNLSIGPLWPTGPTTCEGYLDYFFGQSADQEWIDDLFVFDTQVGAEDTALVEAAQRGTSSGIIDRGWVLGGVENLIGHFQDYLRERLELSDSSGLDEHAVNATDEIGVGPRD